MKCRSGGPRHHLHCARFESFLLAAICVILAQFRSYILRGHGMNNEYTAIIKRDGEWWLGWIEEVPGVNCQENSHKELLNSLRSALREALELNKQDALLSAGADYSEEKIAV